MRQWCSVAAFGLASISLSTYLKWETVTYWNACVPNTQMHVKSTFFDPRLKQGKFPVGAEGGVDNLRHSPDVNTAKLAD
jgi:hypothetical protein